MENQAALGFSKSHRQPLGDRATLGAKTRIVRHTPDAVFGPPFSFPDTARSCGQAISVLVGEHPLPIG